MPSRFRAAIGRTARRSRRRGRPKATKFGAPADEDAEAGEVLADFEALEVAGADANPFRYGLPGKLGAGAVRPGLGLADGHEAIVRRLLRAEQGK